MQSWRTAALDPVWQCLCPQWAQKQTLGASARSLRFFMQPPRQRARPRLQCLNQPQARQYARNRQTEGGALNTFQPFDYNAPPNTRRRLRPREEPPVNYDTEDTRSLYARLHSTAVDGKEQRCREVAVYLVKERREKPNLQIYNALILSNVDHENGAAWRVAALLDEMNEVGLQPDGGTCHAVLKVLAIHLDHLLRTDILEYMRKRWFPLSEDGAHDVAAGLLREGLFEQALHQLDSMKGAMHVDIWLWDMAVYTLCQAGEVDEAYRIMRTRNDQGELISRSVWAYLLDKASEMRHHDATTLAWTTQVNQGYINPPSGTCLNVLGTAARAGDAALGTEVFAHLSKRGTAYQAIHYELLMSCYMSANLPDMKRAISILTIMPLEKLEPTIAETRELCLYLRDKPALVKEAFSLLRDLHSQDRKIPIAVLNLLIECHVEQRNLPEAMKIYKLIHTFAPIKKGAQKSFANIETFNLLLKGCRLADPPDERQASFLVSELLALRVIPTSLTYDRLILVFVSAAKYTLTNARTATDAQDLEAFKAKGLELLDWAFRHFEDMQPLGWMPRFGTLELLAIQLAHVGDGRCWDVLQTAEDYGAEIEGFATKGKWLRANVEDAFEKHGITTRTDVL